MKKKTPEIRVDGVFDIETSDWSTFAVGGYYDSNRGFEYCYDAETFFDKLLAYGGQVWAWNGGLYDFLWFLDIAVKRGLYALVSCAGTRITRVEIGPLVLRDACALIPASLASAAPIGGMELTKETGLPCRCGDDCGGYCSITPNCVGMPDAERDSLISYLELDCRAAWNVLDALFAHAHNNGYTVKGTLGGSAWATAQSILGLDKASWGESLHYHAARAGYFGGRVTVGRVSAISGHCYDINSAYPAALSNLALPVGDYYRMGGARAAMAYANGKEGVYRAVVNVPRCHLPPLPMRTPKDRVCFPIGRMFGSWSGLELRYAESQGVKVEKVIAASVWADSEPIFADFMRGIFDVRAKVGKNTALGKWQKLFGNSLTGKFAQHPENQRILVNPDAEPVRCPGGECAGDRYICRRFRNRCCRHYCSGRCKRWNQIDMYGRIWGVPQWRLPDCGYVHWAAYLTSWTRVTWHRFASQFGDGFLYGDTDSVYAINEASLDSDVGPNLGQWSYDGQISPWTDEDDITRPGWDCIGPKAYRKHHEGEFTTRLKGVPNVSNADWQRFRDGELIENERGVMGLKSAAKKPGDTLFRKKLIKRSDQSDGQWFGDRRLKRNSTITEAVTYGDQCKRER